MQLAPRRGFGAAHVCVSCAVWTLAACSTADTSQDNPDSAPAGTGVGSGAQSLDTGLGGDASDATGDGAAPGTTAGGTGPENSTDGSDGDGTSAGAKDPWTPSPGTTWQWQLIDAIDTSVDVEVYDIDLFDVSAEVISELHADGRIVICYFSAGSYEEWRPDATLFPDAALGSPLDDWPAERWLDHRDADVRLIMEARLDLAVTKACDAVEPDNVDGYANPNGVGLSADDQLDYNGWLAAQAHARGLSVGLKNDLDQLDALAEKFDWALNEECVTFDECAPLKSAFIDAGKAVFHVEYVDTLEQGQAAAGSVCPATTRLGFSSMIKQWDLGPWAIPCWG